ncbi:MAG: AAA family ATPase [Acidobacteria bacterium]|nr:AAA family ATPase [Acidobacteriota bacterium]
MGSVLQAEVKEYTSEVVGTISILVPGPERHQKLVPFVEHKPLVADCRAAFAAGCPIRLEGPPGCGKTSLVHHLADDFPGGLYEMVCTHEMEPGDLICTPRLTEDPQGRYVGSGLVGAMLHGGLAYLDEVSKLSEKSMSCLVAALDHRRSIASSLAGFSLVAHPSFRVAASVNPSDPPLPDFLAQRLTPTFRMDHLSPKALEAVIQAHFTGSDTMPILEGFRAFIAGAKAPIASREALKIVQFATGMARTGSGVKSRRDAEVLVAKAAEHVLRRE